MRLGFVGVDARSSFSFLFAPLTNRLRDRFDEFGVSGPLESVDVLADKRVSVKEITLASEPLRGLTGLYHRSIFVLSLVARLFGVSIPTQAHSSPRTHPGASSNAAVSSGSNYLGFWWEVYRAGVASALTFRMNRYLRS